MTEFVVYEDTPLAEYLTSIDSVETTVKLPSLQRDMTDKKMGASSWISQQILLPRWSDALYHYWRRSLFHDTFSTCLPLAEETEFEEKFKYLVATSPLMSEVMSVHNASKKKHAQQHMTATDYSTPTKKVFRAGSIGTVATISGLLVALGTETIMIQQRQQQRQQQQPPSPTAPLKLIATPALSLTMLLTGGVSMFFVYRHKRRSGIRQLYQTALNRLQTLMEQSETLDSKVHRTLITIQEIELVSRGYRLSTPLSPISRIEQSSKSRRCTALRNHLAAMLRRAFIVYEEAIIDLIDHVNKNNLSHLYDMYNVRSVASLSSIDRIEEDENGVSVERLRALAQLMHAKRRECMMQLLALDIMSEGHDSVRRDYEAGWRGVNTVLTMLVDETKVFVKDIMDALQTELYKPVVESPASLSANGSVTDGRLKPFLHRLASLDQQMRTLEAKFYLCNDDIRQLTSADNGEGISSVEDLRERLKREYMSIQQDFSQMVVEWEAGREALMGFLEPPELDPSPSSSASSHKQGNNLPSPLPSPSLEAQDGQKLFDSEENGVFDLPLPARASVFEAVAETVERNANGRSTKSRAERIAEMRAKREQEVRQRSTRMDPQSMVHELKNVLDRRATEFDLEPHPNTTSNKDDTSNDDAN
ncbi:Mysoin-binding motif of peroxisomes-domain-containing protein [Zychaea mexicana]|uniref:Mysoin-binding motif of peroxisomes-domain-containing protein n=1 Tax=Zychaea mexicana TaxID=64656 RepID=UPI0022FED541|nr:Mysoin-binding motif of peroxisomes-domain-containing protein [Zychaea mexicana]KAI9488274.1 Mysoin-binding motif of peroxisomes-domain-containing protein [Zychaea mexicana]